MKDEKVCISCGSVLLGQGTAIFQCPGCGEVKIGRCKKCRDQSVGYTCPKCGFRGP
jgi:hypothetical protein